MSSFTSTDNQCATQKQNPNFMMGRQPPNDDVFGDESLSHISSFEINDEYARRLRHNREREDRERHKELQRRGIIADENDDEDSGPDEVIVDPKKELKYFDLLVNIKKKDPSIKDKNVKYFSSDEEEEEDGEGKKKDQKKKKMYLKDVQAKHLLEEGPDHAEDGGKVKSYFEKQEEARKALSDALEAGGEEENDEDGELLRVSEKKVDDDFEEDEELVKKVDEYFGKEGEADENNKFLRDFFLKKMWKEKDEKVVIDDAELAELEDDESADSEEDLENRFRHEEDAGDVVMGQSRYVEGSVRKKDNARKSRRKKKEDRMKMAELERQEEVKRLKNIKKKEIKEKMKKVFSVAGFKDGDDCRLDRKDLDDDFDPVEYDKMMKKVFDDKYYGEEDEELDSDEDCEKPDFDQEDELLGLPKDWEVTKGGDGFLTARELALKHKVDDAGDEEVEVEVEEEVEEREEGKRKRKRKTSLVQRAKEALMEEYYKLDYEGTIEDLKTRFKYAKVQPNKFRLDTEEILCLEDTELNQYVPLKKIAPYQEKDWEVNRHKYKEHKQRFKNKLLLLHEDDKHHEKRSKKKRRSEDADVVTTEPAPADEEGEPGKLSRKAKRRRRQAEKKLAPSRMAAYGKAQS